VCDVVNEDGDWKITELNGMLGAETTMNILALLSPTPNARPDMMRWGAETSGEYTVKSRYITLLGQQNSSSSKYWKTIWN